jgi:hypothetical protein
MARHLYKPFMIHQSATSRKIMIATAILLAFKGGNQWMVLFNAIPSCAGMEMVAPVNVLPFA